jgi:hypothetical protein
MMVMSRPRSDKYNDVGQPQNHRRQGPERASDPISFASGGRSRAHRRDGARALWRRPRSLPGDTMPPSPGRGSFAFRAVPRSLRGLAGRFGRRPEAGGPVGQGHIARWQPPPAPRGITDTRAPASRGGRGGPAAAGLPAVPRVRGQPGRGRGRLTAGSRPSVRVVVTADHPVPSARCSRCAGLARPAEADLPDLGGPGRVGCSRSRPGPRPARGSRAQPDHQLGDVRRDVAAGRGRWPKNHPAAPAGALSSCDDPSPGLRPAVE